MEVNADNLNEVMSFDHVIRVMEDGTVDTNPANAPIEPQITMLVDDDGQQVGGDEDLEGLKGHRYPWELMTGYTGQYGYNGPVMHVSETISGGLARDILNTPGYYVALVIEVERDTDEESEETQPAGWAVARIVD